MKASENTAQQLSQLLEQQIQHVSKLLEYIGLERLSMENREIDQIPELLDEKNNIIEKIESVDQTYKSILTESSCSPDRKGMEIFIKRFDHADQFGLRAQWDKLYALIGECRKQNQVNGGVVELSRVRLDQLIGLLRGAVPQSNNGYSPSGKLKSGIDSQPLAKA